MKVTINDRRNDEIECLVLQAADTNNDVVFHDYSRSSTSEEVLIDDKEMVMIIT
jgi:hypothetical protein